MHDRRWNHVGITIVGITKLLKDMQKGFADVGKKFEAVDKRFALV